MEKINGGYIVKLDETEIKVIGHYAPSWERVIDNEGSFTDSAGNYHEALLGHRFTLAIKAARLSYEQYSAVISELKKPSFMLDCPEYTGQAYCKNAPADLKQANYLGERYDINFTVAALAVDPAPGCL